MIENLGDKFSELYTFAKREILLNEVLDLCFVIEKVCKKRKININTLKSSKIIKNKNKVKEQEFLDQLFIYLLYLKEDLGLLLENM